MRRLYRLQSAPMNRIAIAILLLLGALCLHAAEYPQPSPGNFVITETAK